MIPNSHLNLLLPKRRRKKLDWSFLVLEEVFKEEDLVDVSGTTIDSGLQGLASIYFCVYVGNYVFVFVDVWLFAREIEWLLRVVM